MQPGTWSVSGSGRLAVVPDSHRAAVELVDEIGAPTEFVRAAYADCGRPVFHVPMRIDEPTVQSHAVAGWRSRLGLRPDEVMFLSSVVSSRTSTGKTRSASSRLSSVRSAKIRHIVFDW